MRWNKHETPKWGRISNRLDWQHIPHFFFFLVSYKTYKSYFLNWISSLSLICLFFFFFLFLFLNPKPKHCHPSCAFQTKRRKAASMFVAPGQGVLICTGGWFSIPSDDKAKPAETAHNTLWPPPQKKKKKRLSKQQGHSLTIPSSGIWQELTTTLNYGDKIWKLNGGSVLIPIIRERPDKTCRIIYCRPNSQWSIALANTQVLRDVI